MEKKSKFCKMLKEAVADEKKAPLDYDKLKKLSKSKKYSNLFQGIKKQEKNHHRRLITVYNEKCLKR